MHGRFVILLTGLLYNFFEVSSGQFNRRIPQRRQQQRNRQTNIGTVLQAHDHAKFLNLMRRARLYSLSYSKVQYTVFAPNDYVVGNYTKRSSRPFSGIRSYVEYHIFKGKFDLNTLRDGQTIKSFDNHKAIVNKVFNRVTMTTHMWIQGIQVQTLNVKAGNSVIHMIDSHLEKPNQSLFEYIRKSGHHNIVYKLLEKYKIYFQFPFGTTFLAPLDRAFSLLPSKYKEAMFSDDVKAREFLRNHIISRPMCRSRLFHVVGWSRVINNLGNSLSLYQDIYNTEASYVNDAAVLTAMTLTDGWLYGITDALLPDIKYKIMETLRSLECDTFLQHLITTGHLYSLSSLLTTHTVFAPTDKAFEGLSVEVKDRLANDKKFLKTTIMYHVANGKYLTEHFEATGHIVTTAVEKSTNKKQRLIVNTEPIHVAPSAKQELLKANAVNEKKITTVQNARVIEKDKLALNGIVHVIDQVLFRPTKTLYELLQSTRKLRLIRRAIENANASLIGALNNEAVEYTLFAPTNRALKKFYNAFGNDFDDNPGEKMNDLLLRHILPEPFLTTSLEINKQRKLTTMEICNGTNNYIHVLAPSGENKRMRIIEFDSDLIIQNMMATNGVIHIIDRVLYETSGTEAIRNRSLERVKLFKRKWKRKLKNKRKNNLKPVERSENKKDKEK